MLSSFRRYLRAHGIKETAAAVGRRLRSWLSVDERLIVIVKDLTEIVEPYRAGELRLEDLGPEHLPALSELNRIRKRPHVDRRFERNVAAGFHGFVAYKGEELIGYYWWVDAENPVLYPDLAKLGLDIELGPGDVYGSDFYVLEEHRGGGVAADCLFKIESRLRERGYERIWGYVVSDNRPARWTYSLRGYTPMWVIHRKRFLFLQRTSRETS